MMGFLHETVMRLQCLVSAACDLSENTSCQTRQSFLIQRSSWKETVTSPLSPSRLNNVRPSSHYRKPGPQKDTGRQPALRETRGSTWRKSLELARRRAIKLTPNKLHGKCGMCATKEASADSRWMSFLAAGQIQSFFSRPAANLRHAVAPEDDDEETDANSRAAEEEEAFLDARNTILVQCAPVHAIVYDT